MNWSALLGDNNAPQGSTMAVRRVKCPYLTNALTAYFEFRRNIFHDAYVSSMNGRAILLCFTDPPSTGENLIVIDPIVDECLLVVRIMNLFPDLCPCRGQCP